jgi:P-type Cu+ transporter
MLVVAAIMTVGMAMSPELLRANDAPAPVVSTGTERVVLAVDGMTCELCTTTVRMALDGVEGASVVDVTYEPPHATIDIDPGQTDSKELLDAIQGIGYQASLVWESEGGD